jgi:type VI secretion system secreted protein VgrG
MFSTATDPFLQLTTPLPNTFVVTDFAGTEALSELFAYAVNTYCDNLNINAADILTKEVTLQINYNNSKRYFNGIISEFQAGRISNNLRSYTLQISPKAWLLHFKTDHRVFENQEVPSIVKTICQEGGVKVDTSGLKSNYATRDYCTQYGESCWHFVQRLLEEEGIFYYFKQEQGKHTLMLADSVSVLPACPESSVAYQADANTREASVQCWDQHFQFYPGQFSHNDYDFQQPANSLFTQSSQQSALSTASNFSIYTYPGKYTDTDGGAAKADQSFLALQARYQQYTGCSHCIGFAAGNKVTLSDHPDSSQTGSYFFMRVSHAASDSTQLNPDNTTHGEGQIYSNTFVCLPAQVKYRPLLQTAKPRIYGAQTAAVVGNGQEGQEVSVDKYGRIRIRYHWDREGASSGRVRVVQSWSGKNFGAIFHPRIGQEVLVQFEHGDPDRPIVVGALHNANQMPPYTLTDNQTQSGIKTRSTTGGSMSDGNELRFEDKAGAEEVYLHAQKDHTRVIGNNDTTTVQQGDHAINVMAGSSTLEAAKEIRLKVNNSELLIDNSGVYINGQKINLNII